MEVRQRRSESRDLAFSFHFKKNSRVPHPSFSRSLGKTRVGLLEAHSSSSAISAAPPGRSRWVAPPSTSHPPPTATPDAHGCPSTEPPPRTPPAGSTPSSPKPSDPCAAKQPRETSSA